MSDRLDWLETAVAEHQMVPSPWRQSQPTDIVAGDIVAVGAMDGFEAPDRLVAVVEVDSERQCFLGVLVTNELPLATADDVILKHKDTTLPYHIAAMTRLSGHLWFAQVRERVGALTDESLAAIRAGHAGCEHPLQYRRRGLPLQESRSDLRWPTLEAEAEVMQALTDDCNSKRQNPMLGMPFVDPSLLIASRSNDVPNSDQFDQLRHHSRGFSRSCSAWAADNCSRQELRAYAPLFRSSCHPITLDSSQQADTLESNVSSKCGIERSEDEHYLLQQAICDGIREGPFVRLVSLADSGQIQYTLHMRHSDIAHTTT